MVRTRSSGARLMTTINEIHRVRRFRRYRKRYKSNDVAHRHRIKDPQRKTVHVPAHTRRI